MNKARTDRIKPAPIEEPDRPPAGRSTFQVKARPAGSKPATQSPDDPPPGHRGRPVRVKAKGESKCIYFSDATVLERLEEIAATQSRCSVARIVNQLVEGFVKAHQQLNQPDARLIRCDGLIVYL